MTDEQTRLLEEIRDELRLIRKQGERRRPPLTWSEMESTAKLLRAIAGKFGSDGFTCSDVLRDSVLSELAGHPTPKALGDRFSSIKREDFGGLILEPVGKTHNKVLWRVLKN